MKEELFEGLDAKPTHDKLVQIAANWLKKTCSVVVTELATIGEEPDAIGWKSTFSTLVECKVSRSDFLADRKKWFRANPEHGIGAFRYFMTPPDIIRVDELPKKWGLLVLEKTRVRVLRKAEQIYEINQRHEVNILLSTIRRLGPLNPAGTSIRFYTFETKNRATLGIEKTRDLPTLGKNTAPAFQSLETAQPNTIFTGTTPAETQ